MSRSGIRQFGFDLNHPKSSVPPVSRNRPDLMPYTYRSRTRFSLGVATPASIEAMLRPERNSAVKR